MTRNTNEFTELLAARDFAGASVWLSEYGTRDIANELSRLDPTDRATVFRLLVEDRALAVFEALDTVRQQQLINALADESVHVLFHHLDANDRVRLLSEVPATVASRLMENLPHEARANTNRLLGYPEGSVGRTMIPRYASLRAHDTAADALARIRDARLRPGELLVLPVTDEHHKLVGVVDLPHLVAADSAVAVGELLNAETYVVDVEQNREVAARLIQAAGLVALPVVDSEGRLVGVLTVDDAMEVIETKHTKDIHRGGAVEPLGVSYMDAGVFLLARKRAMWLLVLIVAAALTVNVLEFFEPTLEAMVALTVFIPLLIDTGGNSGAQAATVVIRAIALDEVRFRDLPRILYRELRVGLLLGLMLGAAGFPIVTWFYGSDFAFVIAVTLLVICTWASFAGGLLPVVAKRLNIDPAVVSAPVVTTLVDATGLVIYLLIARAVFGL